MLGMCRMIVEIGVVGLLIVRGRVFIFKLGGIIQDMSRGNRECFVRVVLANDDYR